MRNYIKKKLILAVCLAAMLIGMMGVCSQAASLPFTYTEKVRVEYKKGLQNRVRLWLELKNKKYETKQFNNDCKKTFWEMTSSKASVAAKPSKSVFNQLGTGTKYGPLVQLKKAGTTTVKYQVKVNNKTYNCKTKIYVYDYSNPVKSMKLDDKEIDRTNFGMNATEVYYGGEYSTKSSHKLVITPAKDWTVKKIVGKSFNKSKTVELEAGKAFSKKYDEIIVTMKNSKTKVEKTLDIMPF